MSTTLNPEPQPTTDSPTGTVDQVQDWLRDRILERVSQTIATRKAYWAEADHTRPTPADVRKIRRTAATKNAAITAGMTFVPGPAGLLTVPPELLLTLSVTVTMVYDTAVAYGVEDRVDVETVVATALSDTNHGVLGFVFEEGDPTKARRPARRMAGKLASVLARATLGRLLRLAFGRMIPIIGSAGSAWWVRSNTLGIGRRAEELFQRDITEASDADNADLERELDADVARPPEPEESDNLKFARHALLANALRRTEAPTAGQRAHFDAMAKAWGGLPNAAEVLAEAEHPEIDLPLLASVGAEELFADLGAFGDLGAGIPAKWSRELGQSFGLSRADVDDLLHPEA